MRDKRYWSVRTDKDNRELLFSELCAGRLRQGWGYNVNQDLHIIQNEIENGGHWWKNLSDEQNAALPNLRMLSSSNDSIQSGDIILIPNLPRKNYFCLTEVIGEYYFERLKLDNNTDINDIDFDYGHVLPIKLITPDGIDKFNKNVHAKLRATLRTPMRMWNLDGYSEYIENLLTSSRNGVDLHTPSSSDARLSIAWENAFLKAQQTMRSELLLQLDSKFQAAEWEEPIATVLSQLYPGIEVRHTGGRHEHGADIVLQIPNHFGDVPWLIVIQIKNYSEEIGHAVIDQIKQAHKYYGREGKIILGVILTTADKKSSLFDTEKVKAENEIGFPIELILQKKLIKIMTDGLSIKMT